MQRDPLHIEAPAKKEERRGQQGEKPQHRAYALAYTAYVHSLTDLAWYAP